MPITLCGDCAFWKKKRSQANTVSDDDQKEGECHLTVPLNLQITRGGQKAIWPLTYWDDGCGSGEAKEVADGGTTGIGADPSG